MTKRLDIKQLVPKLLAMKSFGAKVTASKLRKNLSGNLHYFNKWDSEINSFLMEDTTEAEAKAAL